MFEPGIGQDIIVSQAYALELLYHIATKLLQSTRAPKQIPGRQLIPINFFSFSKNNDVITCQSETAVATLYGVLALLVGARS